MNIIEAVKLAFEGKKIRREWWGFGDKDNCVHMTNISHDGSISNENLEEVFGTNFKNNEGRRIANFSPQDVLANDWEVVND